MRSDLHFRKISLGEVNSYPPPKKKEKRKEKAAVSFDSDSVESLVGGEMKGRK